MKLLVIAPDGHLEDTEPAHAARALAQAAARGGLAVEVATVPAEADLDRLAPDVVAVVGASRSARDFRERSRARGIASAVVLDDLRVRDPSAIAGADAVVVPSEFAARYLAEVFGVRCAVAPFLVDPGRAVADRPEPRFVTFVDPSADNGAFVFARIADELGRIRPDIPLLIVGTRGSGATLAGAGVAVLARGNVGLQQRTEFPRDHWGITRLAILPTLAWDASPRQAAEALANGVPVIASDRGALPEVVGTAGLVLAIPDRITPATRRLPRADEVAPWVSAIVRLWDDAEALAECRRRASEASRRWVEGGPDSPVAACLSNLRPGAGARVDRPPGRGRSVVLVPFYSVIERPCEQSLRDLESAGVRVVRSEGCPQIDVARNLMASDALNAGADSILFVDADLGFDPLDALRLLARPEPVISGVYAKKRLRALASVFDETVTEVEFGPRSPGSYPLKYAAGGFLRIKAEVLRRMVEVLALPACNTAWGRRDWPFFLPLVAPMEDGSSHYLGEDWAFCHRLRQIGVTPLADTSIRLWHHGPYAYGWEDAGGETPRHESYIIKIEGKSPPR